MNQQLEINAGQVLIAGFRGVQLPEELRKLTVAGKLGGFILFSRNLGEPVEVAALTRDLSATAPAGYPPWIAIDQEGGRVARLGPPVVRLPAMRTLGAINQTQLTYDAAHLLGRQLRELGFNLNFAPVLDVDTNPANPVIGDRSFSGDPETVALHGAAFARGLQDATVAACAKHFPGHGDTESDSHLSLPRLPHNRERLDAVELAPFRALAPWVASIMTAHVLFEAIDEKSPATLSRAVITGVLRTEMKYQGVIVSDDLEMKAISERFSIEKAACAAIEAGCDALLICSDHNRLVTVHEALVRRAQKDSWFSRRLQRAADRSLTARRELQERAPQPPAEIDESRLFDESRPLELRIEAACKECAASSE